MKKIIFLILIPILVFAEVHKVPVGSKGNSLVLNILNNSGEYMENVKICPNGVNEFFK